MFCLDDPIPANRENKYKVNLTCAKLALLTAIGCAGIFVLCVGALWLLNLAVVRYAGIRLIDPVDLESMALDLGLVYAIICLVPLLTIAVGYAIRAWRLRPEKGDDHAHR